MKTSRLFLPFAIALAAFAITGCGPVNTDRAAPAADQAKPSRRPVVAADRKETEPRESRGPTEPPPPANSTDPAVSTKRLQPRAGHIPANRDPASEKPARDDAAVASAVLAAPPDFDDVLPEIGTRKRGEDWPQILGPRRDGKSAEVGLNSAKLAKAPPIRWQRALSESYAIGSIARGRLFQFDRVEGNARLTCLNAETGAELWKFEYPTEYADLYGYNGGPRCSPVIDGNRVYIFGPEGMLHCLKAADGALVWKVDTNAKFGVIPNFFGVGSTPVVHGDLLIAMIGGSPKNEHDRAPGDLTDLTGNGSGLVAFDKYSGAVKYQFSDELSSYASMQVATIDGEPWAFAFARGGLLAFAPETGKTDFHFPWRAKLLESVNASTPVVVGDEVLISETYGPGAAVLKVKPGGYDVVWKDDPLTREKSLQTHWNTPIHHEGFIYACSGRHTNNAELRCVEWKTGKVRWSVADLSRTSLMYVDGHFVCLGEYGNVHVFKANPDKYEEVGRWLLTRPGAEESDMPRPLLNYPCWAAPILSRGLLYLRGDDLLVCLELIEEQ